MNFLPIDKYLIIFPNTLRVEIYLKPTPALEVIELEFTITPTNASLTGYGDGTHAGTAGYSGIAGNSYTKHNFFEMITLFFRRIYLYLRGKLKYYAITRNLHFFK